MTRMRETQRKVLNPGFAYSELAQTALAINVVIAMRLMRLASGGALAQREARRMIMEKGIAFGQAQVAAASKMMMVGGTDAAARDAKAVYRRKLRSNRRRLSR